MVVSCVERSRGIWLKFCGNKKMLLYEKLFGFISKDHFSYYSVYKVVPCTENFRSVCISYHSLAWMIICVMQIASQVSQSTLLIHPSLFVAQVPSLVFSYRRSLWLLVYLFDVSRCSVISASSIAVPPQPKIEYGCWQLSYFHYPLTRWRKKKKKTLTALMFEISTPVFQTKLPYKYFNSLFYPTFFFFQN